MTLIDIRERKVSEHLEITNEVIRPVAEKWLDGMVRETDNLQLAIKSLSEKTITDINGYLYFYDSEGNELGHEFDLAPNSIKPGGEDRLSFMLLPPENFSYAIIEIKANIESKPNHLINMAIVTGAVALIYACKYFMEAWQAS